MMTRRRLSVLLALVLAGSVVSAVSTASRSVAAAADCPPYLTETEAPDGGGQDAGYGRLAASDAVGYNNVWAVGSNPAGGALIDHWDGDSWTVSFSGPYFGQLNAVSFDSADDGWAGGQGNPGPLVEHWTGATWSQVAEPQQLNDFSIRGLAALSPTDVWGLATDPGGRFTYAEHWDGQQWTLNLFHGDSWSPGGITAISSNDVWAVGTDSYNGYLPLASHWNGHSWHSVTVPLPAGATSAILSAVSGLSSDNVWAVGSSNGSAGPTLVEHWDGNAWAQVPSPPPAGDSSSLGSIAMVSNTNGWAAGFVSNGGKSHTFIQHWDGATWSVIATPIEKGTYFGGISALPAAGPWAVGTRYRNGSRETNIALHACPDQVRDAGFVPAANDDGLGQDMEWSFPLGNKTAHRVKDASGLGLFSSAVQAPGQVFLYRYIEAGRYSVRDPSTGHTAVVSVPMSASPRSGDTGTKFTITWASEAAAQGYVFDVQIKRPGSPWRNWFTGLFNTTHATFRTSHVGTYRFQARYRITGNGATSDWSDPLAIVVS